MKTTSETPWLEVCLSLGSNQGDRLAHLHHALDALQHSPHFRAPQRSQLYETAPYGVTDQPAFLNAAVVLETCLPPLELLQWIKTYEQQAGRQARFRWGPREIDVDILVMGALVQRWEEPWLEIPHPQLTLRAFVLAPLLELGAGRVLPDGRTVEACWNALGEADRAAVMRLEGGWEAYSK